jgi:hypothetical protein
MFRIIVGSSTVKFTDLVVPHDLLNTKRVAIDFDRVRLDIYGVWAKRCASLGVVLAADFYPPRHE